MSSSVSSIYCVRNGISDLHLNGFKLDCNPVLGMLANGIYSDRQNKFSETMRMVFR
jgi:hypothetical protein